MEAMAAIGTRAVRQWNILRELVFPGHLDEGRLRSALATAAAVNPFARARREITANGDWRWKIDAGLSVNALSVLDTATPGSDAILRELQAERLCADAGPAFRCFLVRSPNGDRLVFNFCHERTDGIGAMAFLVSLQRAYLGASEASCGDEWIARRYASELTATPNLAPPGLFQPESISHLAAEPTQAVRTDDTHVVRLFFTSSELLKMRQPLSGQSVTVMHRVVAAASIAAAHWNRAHGEHADRICVSVPVNARPKEWVKEGFFGRFGTMFINSSPAERLTMESAVNSVTGQARLMIPLAKAMADGFARPAPAAVMPNSPATPIPNAIVPTVAVSSLGAWEIGAFGNAGPVLKVWAPPLAQPPMGVALGVLSLNGQLLVSLRFAEAMIGRPGALRFAESFRALCL